MVGNTGWVVPARDPESLADAIVDAYREWKDKPDEWADRRAAARSRIAENFSIEAMMAAYEAIWREVAGGRRLNVRLALEHLRCDAIKANALA